MKKSFLCKFKLKCRPFNHSYSFILLFIFISLFITSFLQAQIKIEERVELNPNSKSLRDTTGGKNKIQFQMNKVTNEQSTFLMPYRGRLKVEITYSEAAANSRISLEIRQPFDSVLCEYGNHNVGFTWTSDILDENTPVEFGIDWYWNYYGTIYQGKEAGVWVEHNDHEYIMGFEALGDDWDYNELIIDIQIIPTNIVASISPSEIFPGDTANVILKNRLTDGTLENFPPEQTFEVAKLEGCIFGNILVGDSLSSYFYVAQPIKFVVDTSISVFDTLAADTGKVMLRVGVVNQLNKLKTHNEMVQPSIISDCFVGSFNSESYDNANTKIFNPLEIISPTKNDTNWITAAPQMPSILCRARMKNYIWGEVTFNWEFWVRYTLYRHSFYRADTLCRRTGMIKITGTSTANNTDITSWVVPFNLSNLDSAKFASKQPEIYFRPDYGGDCNEVRNSWTEGDNIFIGGYVFVKVTARNSAGKIIGFVQQNSGEILGKNPAPQTVKDYANPLDYRAIIIHESDKSLMQFNNKDTTKYYTDYNYELPGWQYNRKGYPLYGPPNGFGLAQIDNGPAPDEMDLWNWKNNVDDGRIAFNNDKTISMNYLNKYNAVYVDSIFYMNAYELYNSHNMYWNITLEFKSLFFIWYPVWGWKENPKRGSQNYGKLVYDIYKQLH